VLSEFFHFTGKLVRDETSQVNMPSLVTICGVGSGTTPNNHEMRR
jgi:hypothetical protein